MSKRYCMKIGEAISKFYYNRHLPVSLEEASDLTSYYFLYLLPINSEPKEYTKQKGALSVLLGQELDELDVRLYKGRLLISFPLEQASEITFEMIHNLDYKMRENKTFEDILNVPMALSPKGEIIYGNLKTKQHWVLAGSSQQGKSNALLSIIASLILRSDKNSLQLFLIDPIKHKFKSFRGLPNVYGEAHTSDEAISLIYQLEKIMIKRYQKNQDDLTEDIPIIIVIDELSEVLKLEPKLEKKIESIAALGAEANIRLIIGLQKLSSGILKRAKNLINNLLGRILFRIDNKMSGSILYGNGNLAKLKYPGNCYINGEMGQFMLYSNDILKKILSIHPIKESNYSNELSINPSKIEENKENKEISQNKFSSEIEEIELPDNIIKFLISCLDNGTVAITQLSKYLHIGYPKAKKWILKMEHIGLLKKGERIHSPRIITISGRKYLTEMTEQLDKVISLVGR